MPERDGHAPGTLSWAELATSHPDSAEAFYSSLLGWEYRDDSAGDGQIAGSRPDGRHRRSA